MLYEKVADATAYPDNPDGVPSVEEAEDFLRRFTVIAATTQSSSNSYNHSMLINNLISPFIVRIQITTPSYLVDPVLLKMLFAL